MHQVWLVSCVLAVLTALQGRRARQQSWGGCGGRPGLVLAGCCRPVEGHWWGCAAPGVGSGILDESAPEKGGCGMERFGEPTSRQCCCVVGLGCASAYSECATGNTHQQGSSSHRRSNRSHTRLLCTLITSFSGHGPRTGAPKRLHGPCSRTQLFELVFRW